MTATQRAERIANHDSIDLLWDYECFLAYIKDQLEKERHEGFLEAKKRAEEICEDKCFCENHCRLPSDYHDIECNACDCRDRIEKIILDKQYNS